MSGGHYCYIQYKEAREFLENSSYIEEIDYLALTLKEDYGEIGHRASDASYALAEKIRKARETITALEEEIRHDLNKVQDVWRQVDYHVCNDASKESVIEELTKYNEANKP